MTDDWMGFKNRDSNSCFAGACIVEIHPFIWTENTFMNSLGMNGMDNGTKHKRTDKHIIKPDLSAVAPLERWMG